MVMIISNYMDRIVSHDNKVLDRFVLVGRDSRKVVAFVDKLASDIADSIVLPSHVRF